MIYRTLCILFLASCSVACSLMDYHPYDGKVTGDIDINNTNIQRIEKACKDKTEIKFVLVSDTQRWYDESEDFVEDVNKRDDIDFILHCGDITDFGATNEMLWMRDILNELNQPYVVLIGNHDVLASGEDTYKRIYGSTNFSFIAGNCKFVCLNTNALEYEYSVEIPNMGYIHEQQNDSTESYTKTVYAMHARPFSEQFNNNIADYFQEEIKKSPNVQFCVNGHDHKLKITDLFEDGLMYFGTPCIETRQYLIFTLKADNSYEYELVNF